MAEINPWQKVFWRSHSRRDIAEADADDGKGGGIAESGFKWSTPPLCKLHKAGLQHLESLGWREIEPPPRGTGADASCVPIFTWTTRKGPDFPETGRGGEDGCVFPLVRQLPQRCTDCLDDKRALAELAARSAPLRDVCPSTHLTDAGVERSLLASKGESAENERRWYVKHRRGVKGQSVYPMRAPELQGWLAEKQARHPSSTSCESKQSNNSKDQRPDMCSFLDFVVQEEVRCPAVNENGRRFAVRCHLLVAYVGAGVRGVRRGGGGASIASAPAPNRRAWIHRDVIVLPHAAKYDAKSDAKPVHVSQAGKGHPKPFLLAEIGTAEEAKGSEAVAGKNSGFTESEIFPQLRRIAKCCVAAGADQLLPRPGNNRQLCSTSTLYQVFALDVCVDAEGKAWLLEANSHCAIADGTMSAVDGDVYTRIVRDVVSLLVLPAADPYLPPDPGCFEELAF